MNSERFQINFFDWYELAKNEVMKRWWRSGSQFRFGKFSSVGLLM